MGAIVYTEALPDNRKPAENLPQFHVISPELDTHKGYQVNLQI